MSIKPTGAARFVSAATTAQSGVNQGFVSFRVMIGDGSTPASAADVWAGFYLMQKGSANGFSFNIVSVDYVAQKLQFRTRLQATGGACAAISTMYFNVPYHVTASYDALDSSAQVMTITGVKTLLTTAQSTPIQSATAPIIIGSNSTGTVNRTYAIEDVYWGEGAVLSDADVAWLKDPANDPLAVATGATRRWLWGFRPTSGSVSNGAVISSTAGSALDLTAGITSGQGSLVYAPALAVSAQTTFLSPIVYPSGKTVAIIPVTLVGGNKVYTRSASTSVFPTIKINGGSPITLQGPFYAFNSAAESNSTEAYLYRLPSGQQAPENATVTCSIPAACVTTSAGINDAHTDLACVNKSGKPVHGDEPHDVLVGAESPAPGQTYWSYSKGARNMALAMEVNTATAALRSNGTLAQSGSWNFLALRTANGIDSTTYPMLHAGNSTGLYLFAIKVNPADTGAVTDGSISAITGVFTEQTVYRNLAAGDGWKIRAFSCVMPTYGITLSAPITSAGQTTITLTDVSNLQSGDTTNGGKQWIQIGAERMDLITVNPTTKVCTVVRAFDGTTAAASVGASAPGTAMWHRRSFDTYINLTGPGGSPYYDELIVYGPNDWTPPATPRQLTLDDFDLSYEAQRSPSKFIMDGFTGARIFRTMASAGTFSCTTEPADLRRDDDRYWGSQKHTHYEFTPASFRPFDHTNAEMAYIYLHMETGALGQLAETYAKTMTTAITTIEQNTITITGASDPTSPLIAGVTRIKIDDEWMRVTAVDGDDVEIERAVARPTSEGAGGTVAATHAAGSVTCGWRLHFTDLGQYVARNALPVEIQCTGQHGWHSGQWTAMPSVADNNPLARVPITLSAPAAVGATTLSVSVPADKQVYVCFNLYVKFESETIHVKSYDSSTGVLTLYDNTSIGTAHASGVVGVGLSSGLFAQGRGTGAYVWSNTTTSPVAFYVTGQDRLLWSIYCYIDNNDSSILQGASQAWDTVAPAALNFPGSYYSMEYTFRVTKAMGPGTYHWQNVTLLASDDWIDDVARRALAGLPAGKHKIILEFHNEIWNYFFSAAGPTTAFSQFFGNVDANKWFWWAVLRQKDVVARWKAIFAEESRESEVLAAYPWQTQQVGTMLAACRALGADVDVASTAIYINPGETANHVAAFNASDDEQCCDLWSFDLEYYNGAQGRCNREDGVQVALHRSLTSDRPMQFICYEGGVSTVFPRTGGGWADGTIADVRTRNRDVLYNPVFYLTYRDFFQINRKLFAQPGSTGMDGISQFNHGQPVAGTPWKGSFIDEMWGMTMFDGQPAGRGDGSDGKHDNRTVLATPGKAASKSRVVSLDEAQVSTRLQAAIDYAAQYTAEHTDFTPAAPGVPVTSARPRMGYALMRARR